jgi:DNA-binding CsgD family transcriptional regulator
MLCPELIGRDGELHGLERRLADVHPGTGGVIAVVGAAGAGKSRLVREAARAAEVVVLAGRALPDENPVPFRPLAEALLALARRHQLPADPSLAGFEPHLGRLVPSWGGGAAAADASPILLGEALVRLLGVLSRQGPHVLVIEDLHWADPETLAVVEYLGDALADQASHCVYTTRPVGPAVAAVARLERRQPSAVIRLDPLDQSAVDRMVGTCLATTDPPAGLSEFMHHHSDGNPFLVEELLAGLVAAGTLRRDDGYWDIVGPLTPAVPGSFRDSIRRRLELFDPTTRRILGAASLLGRFFEWDLLPGIADVDARTAADALRAAVDAQLIEVDGDGFRFRHALTREAILDDLLPPERRELATRAWPAIELAHPQLPGPTCQLAADLAEAAGDHPAAASRLVECARRALAAGALTSAEATARRARELADPTPGPDTDAEIALDAEEELVHVLVAAGKTVDALARGAALADQLAAAQAPAARRVDLLVAMMRAAVATGDLDAAEAAASTARTVTDASGDPALVARLDAVTAAVALDRGDVAQAEELSRRAIDGARQTDQPAVLCEGLLVLGRVERPGGMERASRSHREAAEVAEAEGLALWHLRAQQELALDLIEVSGVEPMRTTRDLAARYGAHLTVAVMDLTLADLALGEFERDECLARVTSCIEASRRFELATGSVAQLWLAGAHALAGDDAAMQRAIDAARERDPDDPRILADLYGRVLTTRALVRDEFEDLPELLDQMMSHVRCGSPTTSVYAGRLLWAALETVDGDDLGLAARTELRESTAELGLSYFTASFAVFEAVALGRAGDVEGATAAIGPGVEHLLHAPYGRGLWHAMWLVVTRAAIRDGWGDPVRWLRHTEAWFAELGYDGPARRSRSLLRDAGAPVPRRRGASEVPASLRELGVTSREVDVLKLVVAGRTNREIATELYVSPKTVERHLSSLFDRAGVRNRQALADLGAVHLA